MSMIVHKVTQGSEDWHRVRAGAVTASMIDAIRAKVGMLTEQQATYVAAIKKGIPEAGALVAAGYQKKPTAEAIQKALAGMPVGDWSDTAKNYAFKLAIERITGNPLGDDEFTMWQAVRGQKLEDEARMEHELAADVMVDQVGFVTTDDGKFGASADGWIGEDGGAEYKCYLATSKLRPILLDGDTSFVFGQCQMNMAITGRKWWHFGLYLPDLRPINRHFTLIKIDRDDAWIEGMWADLLDFDKLVEGYRARLLDSGVVAQAPVGIAASGPAEPTTDHPGTAPARNVAPGELPESIF